jgi:uncharacterized membrane protein YhaH (DUF805 family)
MEALELLVFLPALVVGGFSLLFHLSRIGTTEWVRGVASGPRARRFNLWQIMAAIVVVGLLLGAVTAPPGFERGFSVTLLALLVLGWFVRNWCNEFVFLMSLRDEDLPGRHDKLIWVVLLLVLAPIGVWLFQSFRLAHWPEPASVIHGEAGSGPAEGSTATQPV